MDPDPTPTPPRHAQIGAKYRILGVADRGAGTILYEAKNVHTDRPLYVELLDVPDDGARERFLHEAEIAAQLTHGNIVTVYDMGRTRSGSLYVVQERVEGELLSHYVERAGRLKLTEAAEIALALMDALSVAHAAGIVHGSVTTDHVRMVPLSPHRRVPKLLDLGLAWELGREGITRLTVGVRPDGRPPLVAPEVLVHDRVADPRVDVWGMSALLFHCLTGRLPFEARSPRTLTRQLLRMQAPLASSFHPGIHPRVDAFLERGLARDPAERFADMHDARLELAALVREVGDATVEWEERPTDTYRSPSVETSAVAALPLRLGMLVPTQIVAASTEAAADALRAALGERTDVIGFATYAGLVEALAEGEIDLACLPPVAYVRARLAAEVQLLLSVERSGRLGYASALLGRRGVVESIEDVRGKRAAWVDKWSAAGYLAPRALLRERGIDADAELASQGFLGSYDAVLEALSDGSAQVGAAYCALGSRGRLKRTAWTRDHPVVVLGVRGPIPSEAICARPGLAVGTAMRTIRGLTDPARSEAFRRLLDASRFVVADPKAYDALGDAF
ncbi:MAG: PhnD/SsuA/transferrin family substrate-binding protein [Sandaracinaceae bacterium]|nr:PhnD/SsuA/transferrin family substrate-binding protein [Sandaracinaceae bacterium]